MASLNEESIQDIAAEGQEVELTPEQKTTQLTQLLSEGRRELRAGNFEKAGEKFGEAAEFTAQHYGPLAAESFEPNFMYGRALVELSVVESDLFKNALVNMVKKEDGDHEMEEKDGDESMTEEEKERALAQNAEELGRKEIEGTEEEEKKDDEAKGDEAGEELKDKTEDDKAEEEKESTEEIAAGDSKEEGKMEEDSAENEEKEEATEEEEGAEKEDAEDGDEEDEEEDLDNNQLAWEALEVAAKIADNMMEEEGGSEWKRKKAEVLVQLAQCAANDEKYEMALEDLVRARDLMAKIEKETKKGDRLTAEIYSHEGRINRLRNEFALAEESFNKATAVMETILKGVKTEVGESPTDVQKEEFHEMEEIIKDFKERAEDCKGSEAQKKMMATLAEKDKAEQPSTSANSDPTANDISGLVRRKRVHEQAGDSTSPKRQKTMEEKQKEDEEVVLPEMQFEDEYIDRSPPRELARNEVEDDTEVQPDMKEEGGPSGRK